MNEDHQTPQPSEVSKSPESVSQTPASPPPADLKESESGFESPLIKPAGAKERFAAIDTLRGFVLLGILVPNIVTFSWPMAATMDPSEMGDTWANHFAHELTAIVFLTKFMFLFALLFGSGVIMYARKYDDGKTKTKLSTGAKLWYRRCGVLLVFGLIHAYFFWWGDILTTYALCGLALLWWLRRLPVKLQIFGGLGFYLLVMGGFTILMILAAIGVDNGSVSTEQLMPDTREAEMEGYRGSFLDAFAIRAPTTAGIQIMMLIIFVPALTGLMCFAMGLTRAGILTGEKPKRFYLKYGSILLPIGLLTTFLVYNAICRFEHPIPILIWQSIAQPLAIPISLGYAAFLIAISKTPSLSFISKPLAAVGRMALTNYFLHTLLCTTFFYGYGFGYYAKIPFPGLWLVVFTVWAINIAFSLIWLKYFKMGPFEWLWRSATYGRLMPIR